MVEIPNTRLNILLVEDDKDDILFFKEAVEKLEIVNELVIAYNGEEVFSLLCDEKKIFDLIFLDINIPLKDGKQCLKEIKAHEKYKEIPVIMFSGSQAQSDVDEVYELGAHYHVVKPYAHSNYVASLKIVFEKNWKEKQPRPPKEKFVVNLTFN
jgi:CheY-like chemotaxis protein